VATVKKEINCAYY